ncbi:MAG TPA: ribosomal protein S18-alanine N-acetyltransferase [Micropepsaceae bacterium]|nr:ribosomal protein S18-alanine N-acetyltransferase [Micropepsaceae bacterium]
MSADFQLLSPEDAGAMAALHARAFDEPWPQGDFAALLRQEAMLAVGCEEDGALVSFALFGLVAPEAEILTLCVDPARRNQGEGMKLIRAAISLLTVRKISRLFLDVAHTNDAARALYAKAGFAETGRRPRYYRNGADAILMARDIS